MPDDEKQRLLHVALEGPGLEIQVAPGVSLLDAVRSAGLALDSECGGRGTCGECRIRFLEGTLPPTVEDAALLSQEELDEGWRLACQTFLSADCRIAIPRRVARARHRKIRIQTDAIESAAPTASGERRTGYGIAVDVGTTTVVCYLMDLARALQVGVASFANPQSAFGPDVVSRIAYAHRGPAELKDLQRRLVSHLEKHFASLCKSAGIAPDSISIVTAVGNMTMMHLLRGVDPWPLGVAPYEPVFVEAPPFPARKIGFKRFGGAELHILPGVGGHVGSDIVAGVMGLDLTRRSGVSLFIDLGTNGEVVLCSRRVLAGASCAAGPAFEGVHIHSGMAAFPGAIERVDEADGKLEIDTIGDAPPIGLCGSGLVDVVALLLRHRLLLPSGRLVSPQDVPRGVPEDLASRLQDDGHGRSFRLAKKGSGEDIVLTQRDIREVQ
ncbi:MAG TPA: ASKHA domain-containing protein, partial [Coriobacteriia bacterium]